VTLIRDQQRFDVLAVGEARPARPARVQAPAAAVRADAEMSAPVKAAMADLYQRLGMLQTAIEAEDPAEDPEDESEDGEIPGPDEAPDSEDTAADRIDHAPRPSRRIAPCVEQARRAAVERARKGTYVDPVRRKVSSTFDGGEID